ncbi:hypothetical protein CLF_112000 [Clonorchis sinensis]|uniref:Uncharacterized protein n=1 Tax=Clonorchis sinensis TaxID=79923 RepID=G7YM69_CLOSI|nr:hypothetical protein CLF_112000 [Clonorchis sinensis]
MDAALARKGKVWWRHAKRPDTIDKNIHYLQRSGLNLLPFGHERLTSSVNYSHVDRIDHHSLLHHRIRITSQELSHNSGEGIPIFFDYEVITIRLPAAVLSYPDDLIASDLHRMLRVIRFHTNGVNFIRPTVGHDSQNTIEFCLSTGKRRESGAVMRDGSGSQKVIWSFLHPRDRQAQQPNGSVIPTNPEYNSNRRIIRRQVRVSVRGDRKVWWTRKTKERDEAQKSGNAQRLRQLIRATRYPKTTSDPDPALIDSRTKPPSTGDLIETGHCLKSNRHPNSYDEAGGHKE